MLGRLPIKVRREVAFTALSAGSEAMLDKAQQEVPIGKYGQRRGGKHKPGTLRRSLKVEPGKIKGKSVTFSVGASFTEHSLDEAFYGSFIEFGHRIGSRKGIERTRIKTLRTGKRGRPKVIVKKNDLRKQVPPNPFLRRAFNAGKRPAVEKVSNVIRSEVVRLAYVRASL